MVIPRIKSLEHNDSFQSCAAIPGRCTHGMFQQHCKRVHVSGTTNPRANVLTDSVYIASKMRQTHKRSRPSQSASMWKIKSEWKVNLKTLGLSATAISRSMFIPQYVTRETAIVVHLRKAFCSPTSYQKQNEKRKVKMRRYYVASFLFSSHRWIRSTLKKEKPGCSSYCGSKWKPRKIPLFTKTTFHTLNTWMCQCVRSL